MSSTTAGAAELEVALSAEDIDLRDVRKQVNALNRQIDEEFGSFRKALGRLKKLDPNHKLRKAFRADAACQAL